MPSRDIARNIFDNALQSVLPQNFMSKYCHLEEEILYVEDKIYDLSEYKNLYIFGSGKAAYTMAVEIQNILKEKIHKGLVVAPYDNGELKKIEVEIGSHPIPTLKSIDSAKALLKMMQECEEDDLYIYLLSGGSSALIEILKKYTPKKILRMQQS